MRRIGFFGGSFDPVHFGHLKMAAELKSRKQLDEVWFSPANISPFKMGTQPESASHRIEMLRLAIEGIEGFRLYEEEALRPGPSYTIETIKTLASKPDTHFYLILSDESVPGFFDWKEAEEIVNLVPLLIGSRLGSEPPTKGNQKICEAMQKGWMPTNPLKISSTEIRQRLKEGKDCIPYVPGNVLDFIYQNHLYSST